MKCKIHDSMDIDHNHYLRIPKVAALHIHNASICYIYHIVKARQRMYLQRNLANFKVASSSKVRGETLHKKIKRKTLRID